MECPICMEPTVGNNNPRTPFSCDHVICDQCDDKLYVRADDRCPLCRSARTYASSNSQNVTNGALRRSALEQRFMRGEEISATIFFPSSIGLREMDNSFVEFELPTSAGRSEESLPVGSSDGTNPEIQAVVGGLLNTHRVPLREFFGFVRTLRLS